MLSSLETPIDQRLRARRGLDTISWCGWRRACITARIYVVLVPYKSTATNLSSWAVWQKTVSPFSVSWASSWFSFPYIPSTSVKITSIPFYGMWRTSFESFLIYSRVGPSRLGNMMYVFQSGLHPLLQSSTQDPRRTAPCINPCTSFDVQDSVLDQYPLAVLTRWWRCQDPRILAIYVRPNKMPHNTTETNWNVSIQQHSVHACFTILFFVHIFNFFLSQSTAPDPNIHHCRLGHTAQNLYVFFSSIEAKSRKNRRDQILVRPRFLTASPGY